MSELPSTLDLEMEDLDILQTLIAIDDDYAGANEAFEDESTPQLIRHLRNLTPQNPPAPRQDLKPCMSLNVVQLGITQGVSAALTRPIVSDRFLLTGLDESIGSGCLTDFKTKGVLTLTRKDNQTDSSSIEFTSLGEASIHDLCWIDAESGLALIACQTGFLVFKAETRVLTTRWEYETCNKEPEEVRQIATQASRFVTGGSSGRLTMWDLDMNQLGQSSTYNAPVGSVAWHPNFQDVVSFTSDAGEFGCYDARISMQHQNACTLWTGIGGLYAHCFADDYVVALGYSRGSGSLHDLRKTHYPIATWEDPCVKPIGEFTKLPGHGKRVAATGVGGLSIWNFENSEPDLIGFDDPLPRIAEVPRSKIAYTTAGACTGDGIWFQADAAGYVHEYRI